MLKRMCKWRLNCFLPVWKGSQLNFYWIEFGCLQIRVILYCYQSYTICKVLNSLKTIKGLKSIHRIRIRWPGGMFSTQCIVKNEGGIMTRYIGKTELSLLLFSAKLLKHSLQQGKKKRLTLECYGAQENKSKELVNQLCRPTQLWV